MSTADLVLIAGYVIFGILGLIALILPVVLMWLSSVPRQSASDTD